MLRAMVAGLLSVAALVPPASAQGERSMDRGDWRRGGAERPRMPDDRQQRSEQPRPERPRPEGQRQAEWGEVRAPLPPRPDADRGTPRRWDRGAAPTADGAWRSARRDRDLAPPVAPQGQWRADRAEPRRRVGGIDRPPPPAAVWRSQRDDRGWDPDWRREPRYDWGRYRDTRRSAFRLPRYYAPYGWDRGYRRFGVGARLAPMLFAQSYWIDDPWSYRLPDADDPYRWVRYYDDALLVDLDSGAVVDVIHGIFE